MVSGLHREFSWSLARWRLFLRCRRAYFFHYHASWEGWEAHNSRERSGILYRLKKARSIDELALDMFRVALRKGIEEGRVASWGFDLPRKLVSEAYAVGSRQLEEALALEVIQESCSRHGALARFSDALRRIADDFIRSPAEDIVFSVPPGAIITRGLGAPFLVEGIKVWASPDILWRDGGSVKTFSFFHGNVEPEIVVLKNSVDALYAAEFANVSVSGASIDTLSVVLGAKGTGNVVRDRLGEVETCALIRNSTKEMLSLTKLETDVRESLFERTGNTKICEDCRFVSACRDGGDD